MHPELREAGPASSIQALVQARGITPERISYVNLIVREPRAFIQLTRYKRFDGPIMSVWVPESTIGVAAGPQPVRLAWGAQNRGPKNAFIQLKRYMDKMCWILFLRVYL